MVEKMNGTKHKNLHKAYKKYEKTDVDIYYMKMHGGGS
ncbi:hypothetical protein Plano_2919 [Planococcus sp. PAMC 21323]|nr:hypothetical protein Plano_2919 [Planococcus sp. PAMC 21323]